MKILASGMNSSFIKTRFVAASVPGGLHVSKNLPCQDYYKYVKAKNLVAVVSDGAGSAKYGKIGAKVLCETVCDILKNADFDDMEKKVANAVKAVRNKLCLHRFNKSKKENGLADFAATLVGVVYSKNKGLFFHIGDGAAISLDDKNSFIASRPENGCFSCETFFFTQQAWFENLRFTKFNNSKNIFLMSDGLTSFAFCSDFSDIEHKFIDPINSFLNNEKNVVKSRKALINTLNTPRAHKLNSDDKTLLWIEVGND